ncbi:MAG: NADH-quinone oxidoreductase subunit NuoH [Deltaproteobacteria bacterium]|nr:NADH-quinone oxidoreductase subunit NuoH [Deltaproteobacteria bacterium]
MGLTSSELPFIVDLIATLSKIVVVFLIGLNVPPIMLWVERRVPALMQRRRGPNRVGFFKWRLWGLFQAVADAIKLIFKEEAVPAMANKWFFHLGPVFSVFPAFLVLSAMPFGEYIEVMGYQISLVAVQVNVGFLFILAMAGMAIYGVALSGWASTSKYTLLGALRASAQMISYEIPLGLSLIPIALVYNSLDLTEIVKGQSHFWQWGIFLSPLSFIIFLVCMFAETNRTPFDLAEAESELVVGFHTEYGSTKFAAFFLGEYVSMFALSLLCSILFFGGWHLPLLSRENLINLTGSVNLAALVGVGVLFLKAAFFMFLYVWVRWTVPRFRYDQLMKLGWKFLLPLGLANIAVTAGILALNF